MKFKTNPSGRLLCLVCITSLSLSPLRAQVVADGATNTLNNVTNTIVGGVTVGTSGAFTSLVLSDNALLTNSNISFIGLNATAKSNEVRLISATARWQIGAALYVGYDGSFGRLVISNGASVRNVLGILGENVNASNNVVVVTGTNSLWFNNGTLTVGDSGSGSHLVVSNGGVVRNTFGYLGAAPSSNNLALVTGSGSLWSNVSQLYVGGVGPANRLIVSNGGVVQSSQGSVGGSFSASNLVVVTGAGSSWTNAGNFDFGAGCSGNQLVVSNGGVIENTVGRIGSLPSASNNTAVVTDPGSMWINIGDLNIGDLGSGNQLIVTNGGMVQNGAFAYIGMRTGSNRVVVTGTNSLWANATDLRIGSDSSGNQLVITNGGTVRTLNSATLGSPGSNNLVVVTGAGSLWTNRTILLGSGGNQLVISNSGVVKSAASTIGTSGFGGNRVVVTGAGSLWTNSSDAIVGVGNPDNQLVVSDGGTVTALYTITLGSLSTSTNNRIITTGGRLCVTNVGATGVFEIRRGTNVLNAGANEVNRLLVTNAAGFFEFNGGTLNVRTSTVNNGVVFTVGNGTDAATYRMTGAITNRHIFANGLLITSNAVLTGNGTVLGSVTIQNGGTLSPGASVGTMVFSNSPSLQGDALMEISKNGVVRTNDQVQVAGLLTYGGSLTVSDLGPTTLVVGDRFQLFSAASYGGSFAPLNLPSLGAGLVWTNKLLLDGSIEVVAVSLTSPKFSSVTVVGTDLVIGGTGGTPGADYAVLTTTNLAEDLSNWVSLMTNQFDLNGNFSFTNAITPGELQRYFRFRTP